MEYLNLVNRIIAAEHNAKEIVQETKDREAELEAGLQKELEEIRQKAAERAARHIAAAERQMNTQMEADLARWDARLKEAMARVDSADQKYRENWVDTLVCMIVKETP
jgi:flagellar biosynthesis/type III secretory pathway protein FliH